MLPAVGPPALLTPAPAPVRTPAGTLPSRPGTARPPTTSEATATAAPPVRPATVLPGRPGYPAVARRLSASSAGAGRPTGRTRGLVGDRTGSQPATGPDPGAPAAPSTPSAPVEPAGSGSTGSPHLPGGAALPTVTTPSPGLGARSVVLPTGSGCPRAIADDPSFSPD
jgi:hypothetical protein